MLQRADLRVPGLDRVLWVQVAGSDGSGVVHGIRHRRPVDLKVTATVVRQLVRAGVPTVGRAG